MKERPRDCFRLKKNKDTWQLNVALACTEGTKMLH